MRRLMRLAVLGLVSFAASAVNAQSPVPAKYSDVRPLPDTPAIRRAREVVDAINSGSSAQVTALVENSFAPSLRNSAPMERHQAVFANWSGTNQALEVYSARTYDPPRAESTAVLIARSRLLETWRGIVVEVEEQEPFGITSVSVTPARPPSDLPPAKALEPEQVAHELGAFIDRLAKADVFSGTLLLAKDGKVLLTKAVGIANRDFDAPVRLDTKFNLGSMNKMFTGTAAMKLVEQGKLSLDDPISKYLDDSWLPKVDKSKVQVQHLLTHTSGLGSYFNETYNKSSRLLFRNVDDYKPLVAEETLAFEPGTRWAYSNTGMLIVGAVIEKASGMNYFEFVRQHVTGPAGMTNTDCYELDKVNPNLAVGYQRIMTPRGPEYRNNVFDHVMRGGPAGGGYSTVEDLYRFAQALRSGTLLSESGTRELWKPRPEVSSPEYGLGFGTEPTALGRRVGHGGGFTGISANLDIYVDSGWTIAVMSNYGGAAPIVAGKANELILQGR